MKLIALLLFASFVFAQDAAVVAIDAKDVSESVRLYKAMEDAKAAWERHQEAIREKYVFVPNGPESSGQVAVSGTTGALSFYYIGSTSMRSISLNGDRAETPQEVQEREERKREAAKEQAEREKSYRYYRIGFTNGFRFSKDFKFIVPAEYKPVVGNGSCTYGLWNATTPAIGTTGFSYPLTLAQ